MTPTKPTKPTKPGKPGKRVYVVDAGCTFCNTCPDLCPTGAIRMTIDGAVIEPERCIGCGVCAENCASEAIHPVEVDGSGE
jgi:formate hydrogenlyase subunit 6/NADH:ubiquinone oxidoreductase subunit I